MLTSVAAHLVLFVCTHELAGSRLEQYGTSRVMLRVITKTPAVTPPVPAPKPATEREPAPKKQQQRPRKQVTRRQSRPTPKPNTKPTDQPSPKTPPKPVFGVTADSLAGAGTGPAVRRGNTLEKKMEHKPTLPNWVTSEVTPLPTPAPKTPPKAEPYPLHRLTRAPGFRRKVEPVYPAKARARESQGTVLLRIIIDERGRICKVGVVRSPDPALARAAVIAVRRSVMTPGYIGHKAVPVVIKIPYTFVLEG